MNDKDRINIEVGCPIYVEIAGVGEKLKSKLAGLEHKEYLMIRAPAGPRSTMGKMSPGKILVVKYQYQGVVYGFQSHVISMINNPTDLLFIAYPQLVAEQSLRADTRYNSFLTCTVKSGNFETPGTILDISMGGCCCSIPAVEQQDKSQLLGTGTELEITLKTPEIEQAILIKGLVSNNFENNKSAHVGITFKDVDEKLKQDLKEIIFPLFII